LFFYQGSFIRKVEFLNKSSARLVQTFFPCIETSKI